MSQLEEAKLPEYNPDHSGRIILSGYGFSTGNPYLVIDELSDSPERRYRVPFVGKAIHLSVLPERYCIGRYSITTFESEPCPNKEKMKSDDLHCFSCFQAIGFNPAFYNVSRFTLSVQQQAYNLEPHVLYIASFGGDKLKVGISSERRFYTRLLEQGAISSIVIFGFESAYDARWHEKDILGQFKLPETVRAASKRKLLANLASAEVISRELENMRKKIFELYKLEGRKFEKFDFLSIFFCDQRPSGEWIDVSDQDSQSISGYGFGLAGDTLIVKQNDIQYMFGLKSFIGHEIRLSEEIVAMDNSSHQFSLF